MWKFGEHAVTLRIVITRSVLGTKIRCFNTRGRGEGYGEEKRMQTNNVKKDTRKTQCGNNVQMRDVSILVRSCLAKVISGFRK